MKVCVVIPCFNEEEVLPQLFQRVTTAAEEWNCDWEVGCVDDGSRDWTWALLAEQHQHDERWRGISFARTFGHQIAVTAPLRIVFYVGLWVSLLSFLGIAFTLSQKLFPGYYAPHGFPQVQGVTTIISWVLFLGGIQASVDVGAKKPRT